MPNELSDTIVRMREHPELGPALAAADAVLREYGHVLEQLVGDEQFTTQVTNSADIANYGSESRSTNQVRYACENVYGVNWVTSLQIVQPSHTHSTPK